MLENISFVVLLVVCGICLGYVIVESKGKEYKYDMNGFFRDVLLKNNRYYYEKLDPNTFKNVI